MRLETLWAPALLVIFLPMQIALAGSGSGAYNSLETHSLLILSLGPKELKFNSPKSGVLFDINGDGFPERISWPQRSDEYFLVLDVNANRMIDGVHEIFGSSFVLPDGSKVSQGFEALLNFDDNNDGVIDNKDLVFKNLRLWKDYNFNGHIDPDELSTLLFREVRAIDTGYVAMPKLDRYGNEHSLYSRVTLMDASIRSVVEVWFRSSL